MNLLRDIQVLLADHWMMLLVFLLFRKLLFNKYGRGLHPIPGPFLAGFSDFWRFFCTTFSTVHQAHLNLHRKTNSHFVRIGPRTISISDTALIPTIYGTHSAFTKSEYYRLSMMPLDGAYTPSLFTALDERYHTSIKRPIATAYSMSTIIEYEPLVDSTTSLFTSRLDGFAASGVSFDFGVWLQMYAFDVIGEILFSQKLGFLESGTDVAGIMADIRGKISYAACVGQIPFLDRILTKNPLFLKIVPTHPIVTFTLDRMKERVASMAYGAGRKRDFLTRCMEAQARYPDIVTNRMIILYNGDNVAAGSDTTGIALRAIFYHLMKTPACLRRLVEEIDRAEEAGQLSNLVTWHESSRLPYLQACIKEAFRIHPVVGLIIERCVPKGGIVLRGHYLPEGTIVGMNPWVTTRDESVYGADADIFRPERWLEATPEQLTAMDRANLTFGYGKRACIGKNISMLEICKVVPQLLRHYELSFLQPDQEWTVRGGWFVWQDGFEVYIRRRARK
ncbi:hypothetical protein PV08_00829 [Exophiala spinifera]|uniref:Cytochrome P450 oxidoreductase n=1 Tax=Exophiala spinifera TaxID=91928 RepID=A0A0D2C9J4_9EURO|nr:uncharacterized protein PV08_00829 [Exophiala spinifera]KIW20254.1 hypothetical protein PV08_00829 [Exophiala spinifera]